MAQREQSSKHMEEQQTKEGKYKRHVEQEEKRHNRYEEEEKKFIKEAGQDENLVENFLNDDQEELANEATNTEL